MKLWNKRYLEPHPLYYYCYELYYSKTFSLEDQHAYYKVLTFGLRWKTSHGKRTKAKRHVLPSGNKLKSVDPKYQKILEANIPCQSFFHSIGLSQVCMRSLLYLSFTLLLNYLLFNMLMEEKEVWLDSTLANYTSLIIFVFTNFPWYQYK